MPENNVLNILLVGDDEVDVMTVKRAFKKNTITNPRYTAANGLESLAILWGDKTSAIPQGRRLLFNLNMPRMGGIEFLGKLWSNPTLKSTPVIFLTTLNQDSDKVEAYNLLLAIS